MSDTIYNRRPERGLILPYVLATWSGAYVMLIEMISARLLAPWFGNSVYVWGAVIFTFMLSLSFGYLLGGLLTRRRLSIARLALLLAIGALATLPTILAGDALLGQLFDLDIDPRYGSLAGAFILFLPPTMLLGAISPYAIALLVSSRGSVGSVAGTLTFWSTLGSSAGTLATAFYLVLWFRIDHILEGALVLTLLLAAVTLLRHPPRGLRRAQWVGQVGKGGVSLSSRHVIMLAFAAGLVSQASGFAHASTAPGGEAVMLHQEKSLYQNINVFQTNGLICLSFRMKPGGRTQLLQSCQSIATPKHHALDYTQMMLGALYLQPQPKRILMIGLGGGIVPSTLQALYPAATIDIAEVDPAVEAVARGYFDWTPGTHTQVTIQDGRVFVKRAGRKGDRYDIVLIDAFNSDYIPEHLLTREFLGEVRAILAPGGIVVANTFSQGGLYGSESVTYREAFGPFFNIKSTNRIIIARPDGLPSPRQLAANARAVAVALKSYVDDPWNIYRRLSRTVDWDPRSPVLTDNYSPANLLNRNLRRASGQRR